MSEILTNNAAERLAIYPDTIVPQDVAQVLANAEKPHRERSITAKQVAGASMNIISESGPKKMLKPSDVEAKLEHPPYHGASSSKESTEQHVMVHGIFKKDEAYSKSEVDGVEAEELYKLAVEQAKESLKNALLEAENALDRLAELNSIK